MIIKKIKNKEENGTKEGDKNDIKNNMNENNSSVVNQIKEITEQTSNINLENKDKEIIFQIIIMIKKVLI